LRPNKPTDYGPILNAIGDAQIVMIGEASHDISERSEKSLSS
jgi:erythromycin esterase-like protein